MLLQPAKTCARSCSARCGSDCCKAEQGWRAGHQLIGRILSEPTVHLHGLNSVINMCDVSNSKTFSPSDCTGSYPLGAKRVTTSRRLLPSSSKHDFVQSERPRAPCRSEKRSRCARQGPPSPEKTLVRFRQIEVPWFNHPWRATGPEPKRQKRRSLPDPSFASRKKKSENTTQSLWYIEAH